MTLVGNTRRRVSAISARVFKNRSFVVRNFSPFSTLLFLLVRTYPLSPLPMDNNTFKYPAMVEIVGGTIEVTGHLDGRSLISSLWRNLSTSSLAQDGDHFMDRSRGLLQRHLKLIPLQDQKLLRESVDLFVSSIHITQSICKNKV